VSYALWKYLNAPFLLLRPGIEYREVRPWDEQGERWRRLAVTFPPDLTRVVPDQEHRIAKRRGTTHAHASLPVCPK